MAGETCSVLLCDREVAAKRVCIMHYKRLKRNGHTGLRIPQAIADYVAERVVVVDQVEGASLPGCHVWCGTLATNGYGQIGLRSHHKKFAHRISYELAKGPIPEGLVIDHLCHVRSCVNPDHLEAVTNEENLRRGDGFALRNGRRGHCRNGHEYTPANTYINPNNDSDKRCRTCAQLRDLNRKRVA